MHELEAILAGLSSRKPTERETAMRQARALPPEDLLQLVELYQRKFARDRQKPPRQALGTLFVISALLLYFRMEIFNDPLAAKLAIAALFLLPLVFALRRFPERNAIGRLIAEVDTPAFVGTISLMLSEAHFGDDRRLRRELTATLERLLPRLRPEHTRLWTGKQRAAFLFPLSNLTVGDRSQSNTTAELVVPILKALEQVGDKRELDLVRRAVARRVKTDFDLEVHEAAQNCLLFLEARAEEQRQEETLLRASSQIEAVAPEVLLRPASAHDETPPEQLLRPQA